MFTRLLLIDDSPDYCAQLAQKAQEYGMETVFFHNLEEGFEELVASRRIKAVILDGRCYLTPEQSGTARSNFVLKAIRQIQEIEVEYNRVIPFCVNSEHPSDFAEDLEGTAPVFTKSLQHDELFSWLKTEIAALPETVIRKQYYDLFRVIENRFTSEEEELLIDVLQARNSSDQAVIITSLAILRRLLEKLMDIAAIEKLNKQPSAFTDVKGSRTRRILDELHPRILPYELYSSAVALYKICSKYGNHNDPPVPGKVRYSPGKYALKRLVFAFAELIDFLLD
jgi:hypothetical protein